MSGFAQALPALLAREGGFVDHPDDRGGPTNKGITQETYDGWRTGRGLPKRSVRHIEDDEVEAIYHERYWLPVKCEALPWPVSGLHFDATVNHGSGRRRGHPEGKKTGSVHLLQRALGVEDDGIHGPLTQAAIDAANPARLARDMLLVRLVFYRDIVRGDQRQETFLEGWVARLCELYEAVRTSQRTPNGVKTESPE
jgi:lysozyme family protein